MPISMHSAAIRREKMNASGYLRAEHVSDTSYRHKRESTTEPR
jgi:hypothetical protein